MLNKYFETKISKTNILFFIVVLAGLLFDLRASYNSADSFLASIRQMGLQQ